MVSPPKIKPLHTKLIAIFMVIGLVFCIIGLSRLDGTNIISLEKPTMFALAVITQYTIAALYIFIWHTNANLCGLKNISAHDAILHSGIAFLGKYTPGKIAGLFMRGVAVKKDLYSNEKIIKATTIEQFTLIHSGFLICVAAWSTSLDTKQAALLLTLVFLSFLCVFLLPWFFSKTTSFLNKWPKLVSLAKAMEHGFVKSYILILLLTCISWALTALTVYFCIKSFSVDISLMQTLLISTLAFLSGALVFILPAGIGVREGTLVLLLAPYCSAPTAIAIATLHRILTVVVDITIGIYALQKMARHEKV